MRSTKILSSSGHLLVLFHTLHHTASSSLDFIGFLHTGQELLAAWRHVRILVGEGPDRMVCLTSMASVLTLVVSGPAMGSNTRISWKTVLGMYETVGLSGRGTRWSSKLWSSTGAYSAVRTLGDC